MLIQLNRFGLSLQTNYVSLRVKTYQETKIPVKLSQRAFTRGVYMYCRSKYGLPMGNHCDPQWNWFLQNLNTALVVYRIRTLVLFVDFVLHLSD